ncbi:hypothetical protein JVU11DRAFT_5304 [Chiua virens]|nr:hypothetical protein JVU11DRAFT_5304 [Chiua virens]
MSCETTTSPSCRIPRRALPPSLHLVSHPENDGSLRHPRDSQETTETFNQLFHRFFHARRSSTVERLQQVGEEVVEGEKVVRSVRPKNSLRRQKIDQSAPLRRPLHPIISQTTTTSRMSTPQCPPTTLITSFPSLSVSDIPSKSPTNKSPFSAVLLAGEDEECEEEDPDAIWRTEELHRARLAKLTRHLGEEIPAEMVLSPVLLSRGTSRSSVYARCGGYHHRRKSLDPSALVQDSSISAGVVRRSKSLKVRGNIYPILPATSMTPGITSTASGKITTNTVAVIPNPGQPPSTTPETLPPMDAVDGDIQDKRASMDTSRPSVETLSETSPYVSSTTPLSRKPSRRPATADAARRVEKLADFFGVDEEDVSAVTLPYSTAHTVRFSTSTGAAGDLAAGLDVPDPQVEVEVKISKPTRFWNNRGMTRATHLEDVRDKLRAMKAS